MKYSCWGAAKQVTGSMHLLEFSEGYKVLVDCGLDYEKHHQHNPNIRFPFEPSEIDVVLLTHAHIDHSGNIPNLVKQGFSGQIICTEPTAYLLDKLWSDSVNIMNADVKKKKNSAKLYGFKEVKESLSQLLTLPFYEEFELKDDLKFSFYEAGHIIGAASVKMEVREGGKTKRIGFTGDLGNYGSPLVVEPHVMPELDVLVTETTYGDRMHEVTISAKDELKQHVIAACVKQAGKLIIPAFSVGRTQAILYTLNQLFESGELPPIQVFADSPLGMASTAVHNKFRDYLNAEAKASLAAGMDLFDFTNLSLVEDQEDIQEMEYHRGANIIVSSAGMLEGGKIKQHISENIENPLCTVLIAGFCAPGTLGAQLLMGNSTIQVLNKQRYVYAQIKRTDVFSAHPDVHGLKRYISETNHPKLKKILLVHGEESSMENLQQLLAAEIQAEILIPYKGQSFDI